MVTKECRGRRKKGNRIKNDKEKMQKNRETREKDKE